MLPAALLVVGLTGAGPAVAASAQAVPVTASGHVKQLGNAYHGSQVVRFTTTVDPAAGEWTSRVTFAVPQTAGNAGDLLVYLKPVGQRLPTWRWATHTDPAVAGQAPVAGSVQMPTSFNGVSFPVPGASVAFEPGHRTMVLRVVAASLVGVDPDTVGVSLNLPGKEAQISEATAYLGPVAPKSTITPAAKRLTVRHDRTVRVPLSPLSRPAQRRVTFYRGRTPIGIKTLPAKDYRRRVAVVRLSADAERLVRSKGIKLALRTWIDNGSTTTDSAVVTFRASDT